MFSIAFHDNDHVSIAENGDVRIVSDEDELPHFFHALNASDNGLKNETVVEIVFGLIDQ